MKIKILLSVLSVLIVTGCAVEQSRQQAVDSIMSRARQANFEHNVFYSRPNNSAWLAAAWQESQDGSTQQKYYSNSQTFAEIFYSSHSEMKGLSTVLNSALNEKHDCESVKTKIISRGKDEAIYQVNGFNCLTSGPRFNFIMHGKIFDNWNGTYELVYFAKPKFLSPTNESPSSVEQIKQGIDAVDASTFSKTAKIRHIRHTASLSTN